MTIFQRQLTRRPVRSVGRSDSHSRPRCGFTLLEVIVVIGIVLLLTALTVTVATNVLSKSEVRTTENVLRLLDTALGEWQGEAGRSLTWGVIDEPYPGARYDINPDTPQELDTEATMLHRILREIRSNPAAYDILRQIDPDYLRTVEVDDEEQLEVLDAWEKPLYVIHPGRVADPRTFGVDDSAADGVLIDDDGTIRVDATEHSAVPGGMGWERQLGICKNRRICFVSAGPDGRFGNLSAAAGSSDFQDTLDNIYSYPVGRP